MGLWLCKNVTYFVRATHATLPWMMNNNAYWTQWNLDNQKSWPFGTLKGTLREDASRPESIHICASISILQPLYQTFGNRSTFKSSQSNLTSSHYPTYSECEWASEHACTHTFVLITLRFALYKYFIIIIIYGCIINIFTGMIQKEPKGW